MDAVPRGRGASERGAWTTPEEKRPEEELRRLNRMLWGLGNSNQAMVRAASEAELLEAVCRIIVEDCGHAMVWIGFAENDETKSIRPVAHAGFDKGYLETLRLTWADTERGRGPTGTAIRTGKPCGCQNMLTDSNFSPWRQEAIKRGYSSSVVVPLLAGERAFGAITIYAKQPDAFSAGEIQLLTRLAGDLAYGLGAIRMRQARDRAEAELRQARDQLTQANADLERRVEERTAELEEIVGELEQFSYTITHDMRAPLRAMRGFVGMMQEYCGECVSPEKRVCLQRIDISAARMDRLITDALQYSRAVRQEFALAKVDVTSLLQGIFDSYPAFQPPSSRIRIEGSLPSVLANEAGLTQCFSHLLSNAVKFVAPGIVPEVRIRAERLAPRGSSSAQAVRLWFEDNGIGIPKSAQAKIFQMFQRASHDYEGTGIGLALVKKVAERMGGRVGVESELDKGSCFWLEFTAGE